MTIPCTCRNELTEVFPAPCAAGYHHFQAMLETAPTARIEWREDFVSDKDDVCYCKACRPADLLGEESAS